MISGCTAFTAAAPSPSLSSAPGRYASRNTSDLPASFSRISIACGRLRSSTRLRLLRLSATKLTLSSLRIGGVARPMSPCGCKTRINSLNLQSGLVDDLPVHRNLARDARAKHVRPLRHHGKAGFDEFLL